MGAVQPPSKTFRNSRSMCTQISVSRWLSLASASRMWVSFSIATTSIAPWAGAGNIQSRGKKSLGFRLMRSRPASAKMAPFQLLSFNFCIRVLTFPRKSTTWWLGYLLSHCAFRRKLPEAMVPFLWFRKSSPLCKRMSLLDARSKTAASTMPLGSEVGTSFIEWTAISTLPVIMATSSVLVKIPVMPIS